MGVSNMGSQPQPQLQVQVPGGGVQQTPLPVPPQQQFGDTTLTKVFVGGLAWETQKEMLREHFERYGDILEAVIIFDKATGRSKGYGFVTFKEPESAKKACEDPTPVINSRRANCNLASLGARRGSRASTPSPVHLPNAAAAGGGGGMAVPASRGTSTPPLPPSPGHWYYSPTGAHPHAAHFHQQQQQPQPQSPYHHHHGGFPYYAAAYGYSPSYMTDVGYNAKLSPTAAGGGVPAAYVHGHHYAQYPAGMLAAAPAGGMYPVYPFYHHYHPQAHAAMGVPTAHHNHHQIFTPATAGPVATVPAIVTKPPAMPTATVRLAVEQVTA